MKRFFLALMTVSLLFAAGSAPWLPTVSLALLASIGILALTYALAFAFDIRELKFLASEELFQAIATILLIFIILGVETNLDLLASSSLGQPTLPDAAKAQLDAQLDMVKGAFDELHSYGVDVGEQSSKSSFCAIQGQGVNIASCGGYRALTTPAMTAMQIVGLGIAELSAILSLVKFGHAYAFTLLLPVGILLRTFHGTRGAGGLFIALAVALYMLLPLGVIFMSDVNSQVTNGLSQKTFTVNDGGNMVDIQMLKTKTDASGNTVLDLSLSDPESCNPFNVYEGKASVATSVVSYLTSGGAGVWGLTDNKGNYARAHDSFIELSRSSVNFVYAFLVNCTILCVVSLTVMVTGMQAIAKLAGSDVDISALSRVV